MFLINILILIPICFGTLTKSFHVDESKFNDSLGWRSIVFAQWTTILIFSIFGIFYPKKYILFLVFQIIYKLIWINVYCFPLLITKRYSKIPLGITITFLFIILLWIFLIPWSYVF